MTHGLAAALLCITILGPERIPMGEGWQVELRVQLCTHVNEPWVRLQTRDSVRVLTLDGYRYVRLDGGPEHLAPPENWWQTIQAKRLYIGPEPSGVVVEGEGFQERPAR